MIFIGISLLIVGLIVMISTQALLSTQSKSIAAELDLTSVRDAVIEKQGWSVERAEAARVEYVRFLTLLQRKPDFLLVPWPNAEGQDDLDQFWHQHILDTARYEADCKRLFGRMIHHNPHVVRGSGQETDAVGKTQRLYARTFGSDGDGSAAILLAGCGADGTPGTHGAGDGGHGDGSHSCGGHSCGHGCGGHGCGGH